MTEPSTILPCALRGFAPSQVDLQGSAQHRDRMIAMSQRTCWSAFLQRPQHYRSESVVLPSRVGGFSIASLHTQFKADTEVHFKRGRRCGRPRCILKACAQSYELDDAFGSILVPRGSLRLRSAHKSACCNPSPCDPSGDAATMVSH